MEIFEVVGSEVKIGEIILVNSENGVIDLKIVDKDVKEKLLDNSAKYQIISGQICVSKIMKGDYVVLQGRPCKIVSLSTTK